jgi:hypothetical protein
MKDSFREQQNRHILGKKVAHHDLTEEPVAHGGTITIETASVSGLTVSPTWTSNFPLCQETLQRVQFSIMPRTLQRVTESDSALTLYSALGLANTRPWP